MSKSLKTKEKYALQDKFVFSFVGRIVKDKGINELVFSFEKLNKEFENISLLLVGNYEDNLDPISQKSKDIIKETQNIIEAGYQSDIRPFLASSDCFVLPTYREGFPNVVLQASSMELPCIVTNINGCNEIIENNKNGLIVEPKSEEELFLAMRRFLDDKDLAKTLAKKSRDNIVEKYDRKQFFKYLLKEYEEVIDD
jgi:glycosyltransferase involved in cell wall biosynthesis